MNNNVHGKCLRMEILLLFAWFWIGFFFVLHKVQFSFNAFLFCWFTVQHISTTVHNKSWKIQYPLQV